MRRLGVDILRTTFVIVLAMQTACGPTYMDSMSRLVEEYWLVADTSALATVALTDSQQHVVQAALAERYFSLGSVRIKDGRNRVTNDQTRLSNQLVTSSSIGLPDFGPSRWPGSGLLTVDGTTGVLIQEIAALEGGLGAAQVTLSFPQSAVQQEINLLKKTEGFSRRLTAEVRLSATADGEPFEAVLHPQVRVWKHEYMVH